MAQQYDLAVIGAGPGGYNLAVKAAQAGLKVALVGELGGTCLNRGCITTKSLRASLHIHESFEEAMRRQKHDVIAELAGQVRGLVSRPNITHYSGTAYLHSRKEVIVDGNERIYSDIIIIATGSTPIIPKRFDVDRRRVMTSDEIVNLERLPKTILIVGGGYVGCEYANIYSGYGVGTTLVELLTEGILAGQDIDGVNEVLRTFEERSVAVYSGTELKSLELAGEMVRSQLSNNQTLETELVLMSLGRSPNSKGLGLEGLGIRLSDKGAVMVDSRMRTNIPGIYAIGDVTGGVLPLAYVAKAEGDVVLHNIQGSYTEMDYRFIPTMIFTDPEIASVGLKESQLRKEKIEYVVGEFPFKWNAKAQCEADTRGFVKLMFGRKLHGLLGAIIVGSNASDLIHILVPYLNLEATVEEVSKHVFGHPTRAEIISAAAGVAKRKLNS